VRRSVAEPNDLKHAAASALAHRGTLKQSRVTVLENTGVTPGPAAAVSDPNCSFTPLLPRLTVRQVPRELESRESAQAGGQTAAECHGGRHWAQLSPGRTGTQGSCPARGRSGTVTA
jgi:hypothetical protein